MLRREVFTVHLKSEQYITLRLTQRKTAGVVNLARRSRRLLNLAFIRAFEDHLPHRVAHARPLQQRAEGNPRPLRRADRAAFPLRAIALRREETAPVARALHRRRDRALFHRPQLFQREIEWLLHVAFDFQSPRPEIDLRNRMMAPHIKPRDRGEEAVQRPKRHLQIHWLFFADDHPSRRGGARRIERGLFHAAAGCIDVPCSTRSPLVHPIAFMASSRSRWMHSRPTRLGNPVRSRRSMIGPFTAAR